MVGGFIADFTADKTTDTFEDGGTVTIQFTDQSTSLGDITAWEWDFGDGETSTEQNPSHVYADMVDRYDVSLTITSAEGTKTTTKDGYITVHAATYDSASLDLSYAPVSGQTASKPADKFAELLELSDEIREMILDKKPLSEVRKRAKLEGMVFLREVGMEKVQGGVTSLRELNKVTFVE